ncbi:hypothetical protein WOLCODRAFT_107726 [Wolfiporia cocos MD-104 SS10]|uniref:Wax synthase domain-containing protein n=1 Tax=Wolfiporia cocos (strain MD-104) TaxID=742152 RepID=A0A2H3J1Z0_WOLCO|nr:hypothetical protein WOLCODRAFT_107726 [Wolfiporia cocos MD-104 SS10]
MLAYGRPPLPLSLLLLSSTLPACIIALRLPHAVRYAALVGYAFVLSRACSFSTGNVHRDYSLGCLLMGQLITTFHLLCLSDPLAQFRHESDLVPPSELSFPRRVHWSMCVFFSPRGVGWNYQVSNVPPRPSEARWTFVRQQLFAMFRWYLVLDLAHSLHLYCPQPFWHEGGTRSIIAEGLVYRCILIAKIAVQHTQLAAVCVAAGLSAPRDWPAIYGSHADAYTVRRYWGRSHHQMLRRFTSSIGKAVCRLLGLQPGSKASSYMQLYVAFVVSGIMHCGGDLMVGRGIFGASFPFYLMQAIAITLEDAVIGIARRVGLTSSSGWTRFVGYIWSMVWFGISSQWLVNWSMRAGADPAECVSFSLIAMISHRVIHRSRIVGSSLTSVNFEDIVVLVT